MSEILCRPPHIILQDEFILQRISVLTTVLLTRHSLDENALDHWASLTTNTHWYWTYGWSPWLVLSSCGNASQIGNVVLPSSVNHVYWCVRAFRQVNLKILPLDWCLLQKSLNWYQTRGCRCRAVFVSFITSMAMKKFVHNWGLGVINLNSMCHISLNRRV